MKVISNNGEEFSIDQQMIKQSKLFKFYYDGNEQDFLLSNHI